MNIRRTNVKKVLSSVHKMNLGSNVVVLERSYMSNKTDQKTRIMSEEGQYVLNTLEPSKESDVA